MNRLLNRLQGDESGQGLVESAVIIALLCVVSLAAIDGLSSDLKTVYSLIGRTMNSPVSLNAGSAKPGSNPCSGSNPGYGSGSGSGSGARDSRHRDD